MNRIPHSKPPFDSLFEYRKQLQGSSKRGKAFRTGGPGCCNRDTNAPAQSQQCGLGRKDLSRTFLKHRQCLQLFVVTRQLSVDQKVQKQISAPSPSVQPAFSPDGSATAFVDSPQFPARLFRHDLASETRSIIQRPSTLRRRTICCWSGSRHRSLRFTWIYGFRHHNYCKISLLHYDRRPGHP
jgi:hypothetical protein